MKINSNLLLNATYERNNPKIAGKQQKMYVKQQNEQSRPASISSSYGFITAGGSLERGFVIYVADILYI